MAYIWLFCPPPEVSKLGNQILVKPSAIAHESLAPQFSMPIQSFAYLKPTRLLTEFGLLNFTMHNPLALPPSLLPDSGIDNRKSIDPVILDRRLFRLRGTFGTYLSRFQFHSNFPQCLEVNIDVGLSLSGVSGDPIFRQNPVKSRPGYAQLFGGFGNGYEIHRSLKLSHCLRMSRKLLTYDTMRENLAQPETIQGGKFIDSKA
ncbi:MAG: hypothetical protein ACREN8_12125 [Candidatus Dormibacteraceae bacterium]